MKKLLLFLLISVSGFSQRNGLIDADTTTRPKAGTFALAFNTGNLKIIRNSGNSYGVVTTNNTYSNPSWISAIALAKVTGLQTALDLKANTTALNDYLPKSDTSLYVQKVSGYTLISAVEKSKLSGIATGATANSTDAQLRDRSTHTGEQAQSTVTGLVTGLGAKADTSSLATNAENSRIVITGWGDSMTSGAGAQTPYGTFLQGLSGYTYDMQGVGGESSAQIKTRMLAATSKLPNSVIIWAGRNNFDSTSRVISDIAAMVSALGHTRYLVVSVCNAVGEGTGTTAYNRIATINSALSAAYGARYVDVRSHLVSKYNPAIGQDVTDHTADIVPTSLRIDGVHLTSAGDSIVANFLYTKLSTLLIAKDNIASNSVVNNILANPPVLGYGTPNYVYTTGLRAGYTNANTFSPADNSFIRKLTIGSITNGSDQTLHVDGTMYVTDRAYFLGTIPAVIVRGDNNGIIFQNTAGILKAYVQSTLTDFSFDNYTSTGAVILRTNGTERFRISSSGAIGIGNPFPPASSILDITSTTKGVLLPRQTTSEINAISSPVKGLTVFNIDLNTLCFFDGTVWQKCTSTSMN